MSQFLARLLAPFIVVLAFAGYSVNALATDTDQSEGLALIEKQLEEAKKLLEEDSASHKETAQKKAEIDQKLAARQERESEIKEELKQLCEEQDKLTPGSLVACMEKLNN